MMQKNLEEEIVIELVKHFKMLRQQHGLSHNKLALKAGITRSAISQIESGKRTPTLIVCLKLSHALGQNLGTIIAGCEHKIYK